MDKKKAREVMREHQLGFVRLNLRWCAIEELISDSERLEKIEQIVNEEMQIMESDLLWKIKEVLEQE